VVRAPVLECQPNLLWGAENEEHLEDNEKVSSEENIHPGFVTASEDRLLGLEGDPNLKNKKYILFKEGVVFVESQGGILP